MAMEFHTTTTLSDTETTVLAAVAGLAAMGAMIPFEHIAIAREKAQLGGIYGLENYAPEVGSLAFSVHGAVIAGLEHAINMALPQATLLDALGEAVVLPKAVASVAVSLPAMVLTTPVKNAIFLTDRAGEHRVPGGLTWSRSSEPVRVGTPVGALATQCGVPGAVSVSGVLSLWRSLGFTVAGALVYRAALSAGELFGDGEKAAEDCHGIISASKLQNALKVWLFATSASLVAYPIDTLRRRSIVVAYRHARTSRSRREIANRAAGVLERDDAPVADTPLAAPTISTAALFAGAEKFVLHELLRACVAGGLLALATKVYVATRNFARPGTTEESE